MKKLLLLTFALLAVVVQGMAQSVMEQADRIGLIGFWRIMSMHGQSEGKAFSHDLDGKQFYIFKNDGTCQYTTNIGRIAKAKWKLKGKELSVQGNDTINDTKCVDYTFKLVMVTPEKLVLKLGDDEEYVYTTFLKSNATLTPIGSSGHSISEPSTISVTADKKLVLREAAESAHQSCPISLGIVGELTNIVFYDETLILRYDINETYMSVATLSKDRQALHNNIKTMLSNPQGCVKDIMQMVIDADCRLRVLVHGKSSDAVASTVFKADELKILMNTEVSPHEKLTAAIASTQTQLPLNADVGMKITELFQEDGDVVYVVKCDDSMYNISDLRQARDPIKSTMTNNIRNMGPVEREFIKLVVNGDANLVYRYATRSGHIDIKYTNAELKGLLQ